MVVIFLPPAAATGITQERPAAPSMCTVQAPHCAMPQPYLVPVRPTCSRIAHNRGVLGLTLTSSVLPLIVKRAMGFPPGIAVLEISAFAPPKASGLAARPRRVPTPPNAAQRGGLRQRVTRAPRMTLAPDSFATLRDP